MTSQYIITLYDKHRRHTDRRADIQKGDLLIKKIYGATDIHKDCQTDRQKTYRQGDRNAGMKKKQDIKTEVQTDTKTDGQTDRQTGKYINRKS